MNKRRIRKKFHRCYTFFVTGKCTLIEPMWRRSVQLHIFIHLLLKRWKMVYFMLLARQPTTADHQRPTNNQQSTSNQQQLTSNNQRLTINHPC
ncbi:MAG: hypothetical protein KF741_05245 [Ferruginibacter sp.]|nr:hypothetical protein [Bacteroidota bacterium]MBX2918633.1 hypothetical protein [Ferruginibacter sp.]